MQDGARGWRHRLAPSGTLRAAIDLGNPVLVQRRDDGEPSGVSIALEESGQATAQVAT